MVNCFFLYSIFTSSLIFSGIHFYWEYPVQNLSFFIANTKFLTIFTVLYFIYFYGIPLVSDGVEATLNSKSNFFTGLVTVKLSNSHMDHKVCYHYLYYQSNKCSWIEGNKMYNVYPYEPPPPPPTILCSYHPYSRLKKQAGEKTSQGILWFACDK